MSRRGGIRVVVAIVAFGGCLDDTTGPCSTCPELPSPVVVSNPVTIAPLASSAVQRSAPAGAAGEVVFVSLVPGTIPAGGLALITNARTGAAVPAAMADGGFDPVAVEAVADDTLLLEVQLDGGGFAPTMRLIVTATRRPRVVRTNPPPRKRDVPLNSSLVVVFSEPIQSSSASSIRMLRSGAPVNATVTVTADGLRAVIEPDQLLAPNTGYTLSIPTSVTDLDDSALEQSALVEFETGATAALAVVSTQEAALITNPINGALRAFNMNAVLHDDGRVTGYFSIFYPDLGTGSSGRVTCFTIVDGTAAWVGGVAEHSSRNPDNVGAEYLWRVADNGQRGAAVADRLSLARFDPDAPAGQAAQYCATIPVQDQLFDLVGGDLRVAGATAPPSDPPEPSAGVSQIAYWIDGLLIVPADRSVGWPLTMARNDQNPAWSPDGRKLAFQSDRAQAGNWDIWVINWDRTGLTRLTSGPETDQDPAWSPDGSRIAFLRNGSIHVMNADGSGVTRLSFACCDSHPSWSADGSQIVFASSRTGTQAIHVMNADGSGVVQLTAGRDFSPMWSPDGARISFARKTGGPDEGLYIMNADGSGLSQLTAGINGHASWAPDGTRLVYELFGMNLINADGAGILRIHQGFNPVWSPVGTVPSGPVPFRSIEQVSGDAQTGVVGDTLPEQLRVRVVHDDGTPQADVTIRWNVWGPGAGIGVSLGPITVTDSAGYSAVWVKLGNTAGAVRMRAAVVDGTARRGEVVFTATAVSGP